MYSPFTGFFYWKKNKRIAGGKNGNGYWLIKINGVKYYSHRLAWLYMNGKFPNCEIHHKDDCRSNNKWNNLQDLSKSEHKKPL